MEELTIIIIIYFVFLIGESPKSPTKKKPVVDDDSWRCGGCIVDNRQKVIDYYQDKIKRGRISAPSFFIT